MSGSSGVDDPTFRRRSRGGVSAKNVAGIAEGAVAQFEKWVDGELFEAQANSDIRDEQRASMAWLIVAAASAWVPIAIAIWWYYAVRN